MQTSWILCDMQFRQYYSHRIFNEWNTSLICLEVRKRFWIGCPVQYIVAANLLLCKYEQIFDSLLKAYFYVWCLTLATFTLSSKGFLYIETQYIVTEQTFINPVRYTVIYHILLTICCYLHCCGGGSIQVAYFPHVPFIHKRLNWKQIQFSYSIQLKMYWK